MRMRWGRGLVPCRELSWAVPRYSVVSERFKFRPVYSEEVDTFLGDLSESCRAKVLLRIELARRLDINDPQAFKKLEGEIWEFRAKCDVGQIRLLAFWDKRDKVDTLVICCRGLVKKQSQVPKREIDRAKRLRHNYFESSTS